MGNKHLNITSEILKIFKDILENTEKCPNNAVSLYDISMLSSDTNNKIKKIIEMLENKINSTLKHEFRCFYCVIEGFNYKKSEMSLTILLENCYKLKYRKKKGKLFISECNKNSNRKELLELIEPYLSELFDAFLYFKEFYKDPMITKSLNFELGVTSDKGSTSLIIADKDESNEIKLSYENYSESYKYDCNLDDELLNESRDTIFKNIFVRISDCPRWMSSILYRKRQEELREEKYQSEIRKKKKARREKRWEFVKKAFPLVERK